MLAPHDRPDHLLSSGANTFTLAEATQLLERTGDAVRKGLERLTRKRLIFSPARGFYVVIPPQFRRQGTVPATHFIDAMIQALGRRYYVSLVSAASRELTAIDLVQHIDDCGGIDHVSALLDALGPLRIPKLAELAGTRDLATARPHPDRPRPGPPATRTS